MYDALHGEYEKQKDEIIHLQNTHLEMQSYIEQQHERINKQEQELQESFQDASLGDKQENSAPQPVATPSRREL